MNDKYKTCKDCPDRCVYPNCHNTCEGYLSRVEKQKEINENRKVETMLAQHIANSKMRFIKRNK